MKKCMMILAAAMMIAVSAKAEENNNNTTVIKETILTDSVNYRFRIHITEMRKVMNLEEGQIAEVQKINRELSRRISDLKETPADFRRTKLAAIMSDNLASMRRLVTNSQYHVYLNLLNNEFNKAGLNTILYSNDVAMN